MKRWLVEYKFKNWTKTAGRGIGVTAKMKTDRAKEIANKLNNTRMWRSHGRGLSIDVVKNSLNLVVDDYGTEAAHEELNKSVRGYYRLLQDYMARRGQEYVVQTRDSLFAI